MSLAMGMGGSNQMNKECSQLRKNVWRRRVGKYKIKSVLSLSREGKCEEEDQNKCSQSWKGLSMLIFTEISMNSASSHWNRAGAYSLSCPSGGKLLSLQFIFRSVPGFLEVQASHYDLLQHKPCGAGKGISLMAGSIPEVTVESHSFSITILFSQTLQHITAL